MTVEPGRTKRTLRAWLQPIAPGRWGGASRLTGVVLMMFPVSLLVQSVAMMVMSRASTNGAMAILGLLMSALASAGLLLSLPLAGGLLVWDRVRRAKTEGPGVDEAFWRARDRDDIDGRDGGAGSITTRAALAAIYARHHAALSSEVARILAPDKYDRRDVAAAARELSLFQDDVAERELISQGHPIHLIRLAFETDRVELLRQVLRTI